MSEYPILSVIFQGIKCYRGILDRAILLGRQAPSDRLSPLFTLGQSEGGEAWLPIADSVDTKISRTALLLEPRPNLTVFVSNPGDVPLGLNGKVLEPGKSENCEVFLVSLDITLPDRLVRVQVPIDAISRPVTTSADDSLLSWSGQVGSYTILFLDICNFSQLVEKWAPEVTAAFLRSFFEPVTDLIQRHGGRVTSFLGDGLMALFGTVPSSTPHGHNGLLAGLAVLREGRARQWPSQLSIGVHTGEAFIGGVINRAGSVLTAIGVAVNIAARLVGVARRLNAPLVMSEETYQALPAGITISDAVIDDVPSLEMIKGLRVPVAVRCVRPRSAVPETGTSTSLEHT